MSAEKLEADIKTRVQPTLKRQLEQIAGDRHLDVADIVREALRDFVAKPENAAVLTQPTQSQQVAA